MILKPFKVHSLDGKTFYEGEAPQATPVPQAVLLELLREVAALKRHDPNGVRGFKRSTLTLNVPHELLARIDEVTKPVSAPLWHLERPLNGRCAADRDGECSHSQCPQLRDGEPVKSGRHCPLNVQEEDL
jgi:hypothetical protein